MKYFIAISATILCCFSPWAQDISIIPQPAYMKVHKDSFNLSKQTCLVVGNEANETAYFVQKRLKDGLNLQLKEGVSDQCSNELILEIDKGSGFEEEAYTLEIDHNIQIKASSKSGLFYGAQSFLQLLPANVYAPQHTKKIQSLSLPKLIIKDKPRFVHRGFMLDVSRHFATKDEIIKIIDMMAMHKLNVLHMHLTDDHGWRIEIMSFPKLTSVGSIGDFSNLDGPEKYFLTQDEIREIVNFAATRHVMVIPEIEMPGHARAASKAYPEYFDGGSAFNPANPETFTFIEKIMDELIALFPAPYFHIGGDEVAHSTNWTSMPDVQKLMKKEGFTTAEEVEGYFDKQVTNMLVSKGKRPMGWEEVVNFDVNKKTVIQWWRGHIVPSKPLNKSLDNGYNVVMSPNWYVYFDYAQVAGEPGAPWNGNINGPNSLELIYNWEPIPDTLSAEKEALILGIEAQLWTQFMKTTSFREFMIYPRMSALAEINWVARGTKDLKYFHYRMHKQYKRYKASGVNYRTPGWIGDYKYLTH